MRMKRPILSLWLVGVIALGAGIRTPLFAQPAETTPWPGLVGSTQVAAGTEVVIYTAGFTEPNFPPGPTADVGHVGSVGVTLTISDLTAPTGLASSDFTNLQLYRSTDNVFDGSPTDFSLATNTTVNIGATTSLNAVTGGGSRTMSEGVEDFLFVTATIAAGAVGGHTFRVGTAINHAGFQLSGGGTVDNGSAVAAADGNNIVIAAQSPSFVNGAAGGGVGIPFGGEPVIFALLLGTGLYMIRRTSR